MPSASTIEAIVEAVPMVMQVPAERDMPPSASMKSASVISPARTISENFQTWVPEPMSSPRNLPFSIGPPETTIVGRSQLAAPIISDGVVLSQPVSSTTPSIGLARIDSSTSMAARLRNSMVDGRIKVSPRLITGELEREAAHLIDAPLDVLGDLAEVRVARRQLGPRVADADDRPAVEQVARQALVLHPAAVRKAVAVCVPEPRVAAQLFLVVGHDPLPPLNSSRVTARRVQYHT